MLIVVKPDIVIRWLRNSFNLFGDSSLSANIPDALLVTLKSGNLYITWLKPTRSGEQPEFMVNYSNRELMFRSELSQT